MSVPTTPSRRAPRRSARALLLPLALLLGLAPAGGATPQGDRAQKPDQVLWRNRRGSETKLVGLVTENSLARVVIEVDGREQTRDAGEILSVTFGAVPPAYADGVAYAARGDHANAAANFKLAAGDASARDVVRASARLRAARALTNQGATEPAAFTEAKEQFERFLSDHPDNREVPLARFYLARMQRLTGSPAEAAETYRALYKEVAGDTPTAGYPLELGYRAGLQAAEAFLAAGDTLQAREIYAEMETLLPRALAEVGEDSPGVAAELRAIQAQARLGEGYVLLADDSVSQAKTFFNGQIRNAEVRGGALENGARLGLAEALLDEGKAREAQIEFAIVSALDHTDQDREARALVGLAECAMQLPGSASRDQARTWLQAVIDHYGDTPAVLRAQELVEKL